MLMLQLLWFTGWISVMLVLGARSRAAFGMSATGASLFLVLWGAALLLTWTMIRRGRAEGRAGPRAHLLFVPVLLLGLAIPNTIHGDAGVVGLPLLIVSPFAALALCPATAWVARRLGGLLRRRAGAPPPTAAHLPPRTPALTRTLVPALVFPALAAGLLRAPLPAAFEGALAPNGLCGLLFGELAAWGVAAAVIVGSGLDALDGSHDGPLTRALLALAALALLVDATLLPTPSVFAATTHVGWADGAYETVVLPVDGMRRAAPLLLLALTWLLRRDLRALAHGAPPPAWARQLALPALAFVAARFGSPQLGAWSAPGLTALACALAYALDRPSLAAPEGDASRAPTR